MASINDFVIDCVNNVGASLDSHLRTVGKSRNVSGDATYTNFVVDDVLGASIRERVGSNLENTALYAALSNAKNKIERQEFTTNVLYKMCTLVKDPAFLLIGTNTYRLSVLSPHASFKFELDTENILAGVVGTIKVWDWELKIVTPQFLSDSGCANDIFPPTVVGADAIKYTSELKISNISFGEETPVTPVSKAISALRDWRDTKLYGIDAVTAMFNRIKQKQTTVTVSRKLELDISGYDIVQLILPEGADCWLK